MKNKIIRAVTDHFKEDPLRVYRVARFSAKFGFSVEPETIKMMETLKDELKTISAERVFTEFSKALISERPSIFFDVLRSSKVLDIHFKEVYDLIGAEQPAEYHPEGDAYNHTMIVLDKVAKFTEGYEENRKLEIRFGALVHDFGKGLTPKEEYPHHYLHEQRGVQAVAVFGKKLKIPNRLIKCGKTSCMEHMRGGIFYKMKPGKKVDFLERVDKSLLGLDGLQLIVRADNKDCRQFVELGRACLDEIDGNFIRNKYGLREGVEFGEKLHQERTLWMKRHTEN